MTHTNTTAMLARNPLCTCGARMVAAPADPATGYLGGYRCPLHAAAPDLLAALRWIAKKSDMGGQLPSKQTCRSWAIEVAAHARAAIARAERGG